MMRTEKLQATVDVKLDWTYEPTSDSVRALYTKAKSAQWDAATDVNWELPVPFGQRLPETSYFSYSAFTTSPLARRGRDGWDAFQWELQSWMISQFLHGEQGALVVAGRLIEAMPDVDSKICAATQAVDEARHVEVFSRYLREKVPQPYPLTASLDALLANIIDDSRWDMTALGMQVLVEALALAAFRLANRTFHDDLIRQITQMVARDEARHVSFGVLTLDGVVDQLTSAEKREREDLLLEGAALMRRRFLLEDIWERMEVPVSEGVEFAARSELMVQYRQAIFARVITAVEHIGLLTPHVVKGLEALDLVGMSARRRISAATA